VNECRVQDAMSETDERSWPSVSYLHCKWDPIPFWRRRYSAEVDTLTKYAWSTRRLRRCWTCWGAWRVARAECSGTEPS
jgi:hypothetical protein